MDSYKDVWEELGRRYNNVELSIVCDTFIETSEIKLNKLRWSSEREVEYIRAFDIGVMPLFDDIWSRGKCGFKIIQYLAAGVPAVCTPVGINREVVKDGVNGLWANSKAEWIERVQRVDPECGPPTEEMDNGGPAWERWTKCIEDVHNGLR
jgi:glycosyltransferase involved in cell wall biosynthesis